MKSKIYKPISFFVLTYLISFISWITAAVVSRQPGGESMFIIFLIPGMIAPFGAALWMIRSSKVPGLWESMKLRLINLRLIKFSVFFPSLLIIPAAILISALVSILMGGDPAQLKFSEGFSFSIGMTPTLLILILAATFEELGWRGYAIDSLHAGTSYFYATFLFAILWGFWHLPLFFVNGTYQNMIAVENIWFAFNFFAGIVPMAFIFNWVYQQNNKSITAVIIFHFFSNLSQEALNITQITKSIETIVLALIAVVIVLLNKKLFFDKGDLVIEDAD